MTNVAGKRTTTWILIAIVALVAGVGVWFARHRDSPRTAAPAPTSIASERERASITLAELDASATSRAVAVEPATSASGGRVEGRVIDDTGNPVAGVGVTIEAENPSQAPKLAASGPDGTFGFDTKQDELRLYATSADWLTLRSQLWVAADPRPGVIVVEPCVALHGEVVDPEGMSLPNAAIYSVVLARELGRFPEGLVPASVTPHYSRDVDRQGRFVLECANCAPGSALEVKCADYVTRTIPLSADSSSFLRVVLERDPSLMNRWIRGTVERRNGEPATEATVWFGEKQASTNAYGQFQLSYVKQPPDNCPLIAVEAGSQAAMLEGFARQLRESRDGLPPQKIVLGPPTLSIRGRVLDGTRQPVVACTVSLIDPTAVMLGADSNRSVEQWSASGTADVLTNERGEFEVGGLFDRDYRLQVFDKKLLTYLESNAIHAGTHDVEFAFPSDSIVPELSGRIVSRDGSPIGGARVVVSVASQKVVIPKGPYSGYGSESTTNKDRATTDADGFFKFKNVPRYFADVQVSGDGLMELRLPILDLDARRLVVIEMDRACEFRLEGQPADKGDLSIAVFDARQKELEVRRPTDPKFSTRRQRLSKNSAGTYMAGESAIEIALFTLDGALLGRRPVRLVPGRVSIVKW